MTPHYEVRNSPFSYPHALPNNRPSSSPIRVSALWTDHIQDKEQIRQPIYDLAYSPDGAQLIVAAGTHVLVYQSETGIFIQSLRGHKEPVYTVDYAMDGKKFASGGMDKTVIVWSSKMEGTLKYTHSESIQKVQFNPVSGQLLSCGLMDFGIWSSEQKSITKFKVGEFYSVDA